MPRKTNVPFPILGFQPLAGSEPLVREDVAMQAVIAGSAVEFSPDEMQQLLQRCVEELCIMRSRGNIYFVLQVLYKC